MQIAQERRNVTFQWLYTTTRLMLVSMLPVIANRHMSSAATAS